jgi:hypothetical protein
LTALLNTIRTLPPEARKELQDFAEFLKFRYSTSNKPHKLKLDWVGGMKEYKDEFTSLELQHKITEWW